MEEEGWRRRDRGGGVEEEGWRGRGGVEEEEDQRNYYNTSYQTPLWDVVWLPLTDGLLHVLNVFTILSKHS